jgi:hypothetical protein
MPCGMIEVRLIASSTCIHADGDLLGFEGLGGGSELLVAAVETPVLENQGKGAVNYPAPRQHLEALGLGAAAFATQCTRRPAWR